MELPVFILGFVLGSLVWFDLSEAIHIPFDYVKEMVFE
jgi:hypothetical protein